MNSDMKAGALVAILAPVFVVGIVILTLPFSLYNAFVVSKMYAWFVVPLGAPTLNIWWIWGIMMLIGLVVPINTATDEKSSWQKSVGLLLARLLGASLVLLFGYILKGHIQ